jgi:hypothetical protein
LESFETSFQQDLNGDGMIGPPPPPPPPALTVIESYGTTSLLTDGTHYFLQPAGGSAVELSYGGTPVYTGEYGAWTWIGTEQTATGYEVALSMPGANQYGVWYTDNSGNFTSDPLGGAVSGTSTALESFETSFQQDLNGDGIIGVPPPPTSAGQPTFTYQGVDADGAQVYDITWSNSGLQPFAVRVLTPNDPSTNYPHTFLYDLPVEAGLAQSNFGDGLDELQKLNVQNQYNATIVEPIFPTDSWYADNPNDPTINYETFMSTILPQWVDSNFDPSGTDKNLLIGFSKSGIGAVDLELKHPSVFSAVAAFDFPADMSSYDQFGSDSADNYGTQANFQDNYQLTTGFINALKAPFATEDRIWMSEGPDYGSQVADFDALLTSQGVMHTLSTTETNDAHSWSGGWLSNAVVGLYGLEQKLNSGASA